MIERLQLTKFTAFESLDMRFAPGVNLLIGHNGTGKTHVLKLLYAVLSAHHEGKDVADKLQAAFLPAAKALGRLVRWKGRGNAKAVIEGYGKTVRLSISKSATDEVDCTNGWREGQLSDSAYVPVKEMLANAPGFISLYRTREVHFEEVYADILYKAFMPPLREPALNGRRALLDAIEEVLGGTVVAHEEQFFLRSEDGELEFTLVAEGMRKLGLLWVLIQNGTLAPGATLFWDEPEANLNPSMLRAVVKVLLALQREGVQVFIATHNYVLLKEFDLQKGTKDRVRFFSLQRDSQAEPISVRSGGRYSDIVPNQISDAYSQIYDAEVQRSLGGAAK